MPLLSRPQSSQTTNKPRNTQSTRVSMSNRSLSGSNSGIDLQFTLRNTFGKEYFRGCQREVIEAAIDEKDVFVLAPTGMGKSLCYQLPAFAIDHGLTLVVSPLLALMSNQVSYLKSLSLPAATLNSTLPSSERDRIYDDLKCGHPRTRLLYITPELASKGNFRKTLQKIHRNGELKRFVIDEGHCISEWGHDFRKDYRCLSYFRLDFHPVPIMVLTATATEKVRCDILKLLRLSPPRLKSFVMSFNRPNLHYEVIYKSANEDPYPQILRMIRDFNENRGRRLTREGQKATFRPVCGIVYASRRVLCDAFAQRLNSDGIKTAAYHAGLETKERERVLQQWIDGKELGVVVATVAFGMGVDRADVRFVIHVELPKSIEAYYQESGRAGRDRKTARCILFYSREDAERTRYLITQTEARRDADGIRASQRPAGMKNFEAMVQYCESTTTCRHKSLCQYFGDTVPEVIKKPGEINRFCDFACDVCRDPEGTRKRKQDKLTPVGSQDDFYTREEVTRDVELGIFDMNLERAPDVEQVDEEQDPVTIEPDYEAERENIAPDLESPLPIVPTAANTAVAAKKRKQDEEASTITKSPRLISKNVTESQRKETKNEFLTLLNALTPPDNIPHLLVLTSRRLELLLHDRVLTDRGTTRNVLGRSSTLAIPGRSKNLASLYFKKKEKMMENIRSYVQIATKEDARLEDVQQGEIWEIVREILDEHKSLEKA